MICCPCCYESINLQSKVKQLQNNLLRVIPYQLTSAFLCTHKLTASRRVMVCHKCRKLLVSHVHLRLKVIESVLFVIISRKLGRAKIFQIEHPLNSLRRGQGSDYNQNAVPATLLHSGGCILLLELHPWERSEGIVPKGSHKCENLSILFCLWYFGRKIFKHYIFEYTQTIAIIKACNYGCKIIHIYLYI